MGFKDLIPAFFNFNKPQPKSANVLRHIPLVQQLQRVRQDASKYKIAVQTAESVQFPNRYLLCQLYQEVVLDGQIESAMLQRKMRVMSKRFKLVESTGKTNEEKTQLLNKKWFYQFMDLSMDSIFWGYSLIQFGPVKDDNFISVDLVPRIYVRPELGLVSPTTASVTEGTKYLEKPYSNWCLGIGEKNDLGILLKLAPYAIWKKNSLSAWAEYAEIFGSPIRVGKTQVRDEALRLNMENMLKNMGNASWAVTDVDDLIDVIETNRTDAYEVFDKMIERCNSEISKIILGQTGTTDEKSFTGSSEVHERIADQIGVKDAINMKFYINDMLLPMLNNLGFGFEGLRFEYDEAEQISIKDQAQIDASFAPYYKFDKKYLEQKYGFVISEDDEDENNPASVSAKLKNLYK